jgi:hypothetical protein
MAWTAGTLTGGGGTLCHEVQTPDDVGVISLGYIASYVVVVPAQDEGVNGQFYWIEPGETTIDRVEFCDGRTRTGSDFASGRVRRPILAPRVEHDGSVVFHREFR